MYFEAEIQPAEVKNNNKHNEAVKNECLQQPRFYITARGPKVTV